MANLAKVEDPGIGGSGGMTEDFAAGRIRRLVHPDDIFRQAWTVQHRGRKFKAEASAVCVCAGVRGEGGIFDSSAYNAKACLSFLFSSAALGAILRPL